MTVVKLKGVLSSPWWDAIYRAIALLSLIAAITVYYQQRSFIDCIAAYNNAQSRSGTARSQAIEDSLTAIDDTIHTVATATTREQVRDALANYEKAREDAKKKRAENPPPAPPSQACG